MNIALDMKEKRKLILEKDMKRLEQALKNGK